MQNKDYEIYWCCIKNNVRNVNYLRVIPKELTPWHTSERNPLRGGECIQIRKTGKPDRPRVFLEFDYFTIGNMIPTFITCNQNTNIRVVID